MNIRGDAIRDPLTGAPVVIVASRQERPNLPAGCPVCPGDLEAEEPYDVRWFPNRWPPFRTDELRSCSLPRPPRAGIVAPRMVVTDLER